MEEKKKNVSTIITWVLITIAIIVLVINGILMFYKKETKISSTENLNKQQGKENIETSMIGESTDKQYTTSTEEINTENSFAIYQENYKKAFTNLIEGENIIEIYPDYEVEGVYRIYIDSNGDAYFEFEEDSQLYSKYGKKYKVDTNVVNIFICSVGSAGTEVIFLKLDGTASRVDAFNLEQNSEVKCEKIQYVKNAVNVVEFTILDSKNEIGEGTYAFIDINGNVITEN